MFFVMMYNQKGNTAMPIVNEDDEVMFYETEEIAREKMKNHPFASRFGYEIYEIYLKEE